MTTPADLPELPPYIYGREAGANERVWTEAAIRADRQACYAAGMEYAALICAHRAAVQGQRHIAEDNDYAGERRIEAEGCAAAIRAAQHEKQATE